VDLEVRALHPDLSVVPVRVRLDERLPRMVALEGDALDPRCERSPVDAGETIRALGGLPRLQPLGRPAR